MRCVPAVALAGTGHRGAGTWAGLAHDSRQHAGRRHGDVRIACIVYGYAKRCLSVGAADESGIGEPCSAGVHLRYEAVDVAGA